MPCFLLNNQLITNLKNRHLMKHNRTNWPHSRTFILSICIVLIITQTCFSAIATAGNSNFITKDEPVQKHKTKAYTSRNNPSVKLYPDAVNKTIHVIARKNYGKFIDFFVFDMEGTLIQNYKMKSKDHMKISGLKKGSYVFRVFCGDEETAFGNFEIK